MPNDNDLIRRGDLKDLLLKRSFFPAIVAAALKEIPKVDAVEVIRCKDCIHWYDKEETCLKIYSDGDVSQYAWQLRAPNDFCSYGERKDDDSRT